MLLNASRAVALAAAALAVAPAVASADSLVFLKDANVFLAKGDGTGLHQVTSDGTAGSPYRSPSQADSGLIAVSKGEQIVLLQQNGEVVRRIDPPALVNSTSHAVDGIPFDVAISPDGARIAYSFVDVSCPPGADCNVARQTTGFVSAEGAKLPGNLYNRGNASWVTSTRSLVSGGFGGHVNLHDAGADAEVHWFDDADVWGMGSATDFGDAEVSRDGKWLAGLRGYGNDTHIMWFKVSGDPRTGAPPSTPVGHCATNLAPGFSSPTIAPDGSALAWTEPDGIWMKRDLANCATPQGFLAIPGGREPHWGPANVNPQPRPAPPAPQQPGPKPTPQPPVKPQPKPTGTTTDTTTSAVTITPARLAALSGRGLAISVPCAGACKVTVELVADAKTAKALRLKRTRRAARTSTTLRTAGTANLSLKLPRKHTRHLRKLRTATFTAVVTIDATGKKTTSRHPVTLRR